MRIVLPLVLIGATWLTWYRVSLAEARAHEAPTAFEAANATFWSPTLEESVSLVDGRGEVRLAEGATGLARWVMLETAAVGDLDMDGVPERVVVGAANLGGSGTWRELLVVRREGGMVEVAASLSLGDRTDVRELRIEQGHLVVGALSHGAGDSMSTPGQPTVWRYRLEGGELRAF